MAVVDRLSYVNREQQSGSLQPFQISNNLMYGMVFPADLAQLQRLVDTKLNHDPSGRVAYAAYLPFLLFGFSSIEYVAAVNPPYSELGGAQEYELAVWLPVRRCGSLRPLLFAPYLFVNNPLAVIQGREIYGFAKEMSWLGREHWPEHFPVGAFVAHDGGGLRDRHWTHVLSVERVGAERAARPRRSWRTFADAATDLRAAVAQTTRAAPLARLSALLGNIWPPNAPMVLCKQFADCADPSQSCYRGIVESSFRVTHIDHGYILPDPYVLRLPPESDHPIAKDLGLLDGTRALLAYEMKFDFRLEAGREIWSTSTERPAGAVSLLAQVRNAAEALPRQAVDLGVSAVQLAASWIQPTPPVATIPVPSLPPITRGRRRREKIVILGGGVGAITAAFALTEVPQWRERYDITIYQLGWRLGGKGASGRDGAHHDRIEEHGIHVWFGFYENAFRIMRRCFRALSDFDEQAYEDAILRGFEPFNLTALMRHRGDGSWRPSAIRMPPTPGWPGDESAFGLPSEPHDYVAALLRWVLSHLLHSDVPPEVADTGYVAGAAEHDIGPLRERLAAAVPTHPRLGIDLPFHPANVLAAAVALAESAVERRVASALDAAAIAAALGHIVQWLREAFSAIGPVDDLGVQLRTQADLATAAVRGLLEDGAVIHGFEVLNDQDFATWLARHGAHPETLQSEWIRAIYSQGFAFVGGDVDQPRAAAGMAVRGLGRMLLTYRHSFVFKMKSGMGDTIFAPLYEVLQSRGVKFKFFHRVRSLEVAPDGRKIDRIRIGRQATPKKSYPYLRTVKDRRCWPNQPDYSQLREGQEMLELAAQPGAYVNLESAWSSWGPQFEHDVVLRAGVDFDRVILGISLGALREICAPLIKVNESWKRMVDTVQTVRTQGFQLWLNKRVDETGWPAAFLAVNGGPQSVPSGPILTAFVEPLDTWGDMTHTLATENWPPEQQVRQIAYFCGPMADRQGDIDEPKWYSDPSFPRKMKSRVVSEVRNFLEQHARVLWPALQRGNGFDWDALVCTTADQGEQRLLDQFFIANIDPSERYVLSLPGTVDARLRADQSGFENLYLAGDWTLNGINAGCVEAATMSGLRAARAIGGWPERIIGEEHLDRS